MAKTIIGLTGGIGSGKSTVANFFTTLGIPLVDADLIAKQQVAKGSDALKLIQQQFGDDILLSDGNLNRAKLRELIFSNQAHKEWLNQLLHPRIRAEIIMQLQTADGKFVLLDAPLLFENGLNKLCNKSIVVDVPEDIQLARASLRDSQSTEAIKAIISAQMPRSNKLELADYIIDNSASLEQTEQQVTQLYTELCNL